MTGRYAVNTSVSVDKSRIEIEHILRRYGAEDFIFGSTRGKAMIRFEMNRRQVCFVLPLPEPKDKQFTHTEARNRQRTPEDAHAAWEQACRQKWRALSLAVKAKLEVVASGIATFDDEFMSYILLPGGMTVGDWMAPQIEEAYTSGRMPKLLPEAKALGQ